MASHSTGLDYWRRNLEFEVSDAFEGLQTSRSFVYVSDKWCSFKCWLVFACRCYANLFPVDRWQAISLSLTTGLLASSPWNTIIIHNKRRQDIMTLVRLPSTYITITPKGSNTESLAVPQSVFNVDYGNSSKRYAYTGPVIWRDVSKSVSLAGEEPGSIHTCLIHVILHKSTRSLSFSAIILKRFRNDLGTNNIRQCYRTRDPWHRETRETRCSETSEAYDTRVGWTVGVVKLDSINRAKKDLISITKNSYMPWHTTTGKIWVTFNGYDGLHSPIFGGPERTGTIISPGHTVTCPYDVCRAGCADLESIHQMIPPNDLSRKYHAPPVAAWHMYDKVSIW